MKLVVTKTNLKNSLKVVSGAIKNDANLPILKNVLIKTVEDNIKVISTNLELAITSNLSGKIIEEGEITIPFSVLIEIINNIQLERLNIDSKDSKIEIQSDNYNAIINSQSPENFPIIPQIKNKNNFIEIRGDTLKEGLNQVISSAQTTEIRPELNSILFVYNIESIKLTTSDGSRLSEKTMPQTQFKSNFKNEFKILIPLKTTTELISIINENEDIQIFIDENQILFKSNNFELISRLVSGNFPEYEHIIPKNFKSEIILNKEELISAIKLVSVFSNKTLAINLKTNPNKKILEIYSQNQILGENKYVISAKIKGEEQEISFNWRFLLDGLKNIKSEDVFLGINEENKPALIKSLNDVYYFYILMPIIGL